MKNICPIMLACAFLAVSASNAKARENEELPAEKQVKRLNFMVSSEQKHFDQAGFSFQFQAVLHRFFVRNTFYLVVYYAAYQFF